MNMISGSTGLSGAADSTFVLQKNSRLANVASLHCTGRDIPDRTLKLEFGEEDHVWKLLEDSKTCSSASKISTLQLVHLFSALLSADPTYTGTPSALSAKIDPDGRLGITPKKVTRLALESVETLRENGILVKTYRSNGKRLIFAPECRKCRSSAPWEKSTLSTLSACVERLHRAVRRVSPLCAAFRPDCEMCARRSRKSPRCANVRASPEQCRESPPQRRNPPVREEPASHLVGASAPAPASSTGKSVPCSARSQHRIWPSRRRPRLPATCSSVPGRSPLPTSLVGNERKNEKRQTIQHPNLSTGFGNDTPESSTGAHEPERLCDRVLSRKTYRHSRRTERSPAAAESHWQQPQPAGGAGEHGESPVRQSGFCCAGVFQDQHISAGNAGGRCAKIAIFHFVNYKKGTQTRGCMKGVMRYVSQLRKTLLGWTAACQRHRLSAGNSVR